MLSRRKTFKLKKSDMEFAFRFLCRSQDAPRTRPVSLRRVGPLGLGQVEAVHRCEQQVHGEGGLEARRRPAGFSKPVPVAGKCPSRRPRFCSMPESYF